MNLVFLGPPGAGKGTQATRVAGERGIAHISTGDMLRGAVSAGTPVGEQAKGYLDRGELVPDQVIADVVEERIQADDCVPGFLLDGFPRTSPQATLLDAALERQARELDAVILIEVPEDEIMKRLAKRDEGRSDDNPDVIRRRLSIYAEQTEPLRDLYQSRGSLSVIDGLGTADEVASRISHALAGVVS